MARVISIHQYELKPEIDVTNFEQAIVAAEARGLLRLPGLVGHHFIRGIKGERLGKYAAVWIYESRDAWETLWGSPDEPRRFPQYPASWRIWEEEVLAPYLTQIPDAIAFTAYEEL
jgi:hypothetical protein